jgi:hypothetical protein
MNTSNLPGSSLEDSTVDTRIKLAALWASAMFCYIYGDYFELYIPGKLAGMLEGKIQPLGPVTQAALLGTSVMMAIPSVMVFLSLVMKPRINRWANIILGAIYTLIMLLVIQGTWTFYKFFGIVEILLTSTIVWQAWKWPRNA